MTGLFAERLDALGNLLAIKGIQESELIILCENRKEVEGFLISVKGIGPKVLKNFFALRKVD